MAALAPFPLTDSERPEVVAELEQTRAVLRNLLARQRAPWNPQMRVKLGWQISACKRHIGLMERRLERTE